MKFGIIAAVLIVPGVSVVLVHFFCPSAIDSVPLGLALTIIAYFVFIGPLSAFLMSIMGISSDKYKYLAVLTMLLSIAWIVVVCWIIYSFMTADWLI